MIYVFIYIYRVSKETNLTGEPHLVVKHMVEKLFLLMNLVYHLVERHLMFIYRWMVRPNMNLLEGIYGMLYIYINRNEFVLWVAIEEQWSDWMCQGLCIAVCSTFTTNAEFECQMEHIRFFSCQPEINKQIIPSQGRVVSCFLISGASRQCFFQSACRMGVGMGMSQRTTRYPRVVSTYGYLTNPTRFLYPQSIGKWPRNYAKTARCKYNWQLRSENIPM
jgi:hypothetical protein